MLSNYTGGLHDAEPASIRTRLFFQLFNPVNWVGCLNTAIAQQVTTFVEFGGGLGAEEGPAAKRPNLESIIRKTLKGSAASRPGTSRRSIARRCARRLPPSPARLSPMVDLLLHLVDFILHLDVHLDELVANYGMWIYAILFLIIFCETGLVVMPLLPGDSLLFAAGAVAASGRLDIVVLCVLLDGRRHPGQCRQLLGWPPGRRRGAARGFRA